MSDPLLIAEHAAQVAESLHEMTCELQKSPENLDLAFALCNVTVRFERFLQLMPPSVMAELRRIRCTDYD